MKYLLSLLILLVPSVALAQEPPSTFEGLVEGMVDAAKGSQWSVFVSLLIMVLVFLATKIPVIHEYLPPAARPWVAAVAGVLAAVSAEAFTSGDWMKAVMSGLVTGAAASGFWSLVGRHTLGRKSAQSEE